MDADRTQGERPGKISIRFGAGAEASSQGDLEQSLELLREKIRRDAGEIVDILRVDLPDFMVREVKTRLLKNVDFARSLSDEQGKALKDAARAAGEGAASDICGRLEDPGYWLPGEGESLDAGSEIKDNQRVYNTLQEVGGHLQALLEKHGFSGADSEDFSEVYKPPTWFIPGKGLLISLVETYWRNVSEYQSLHSTLQSMKTKELQQEVESRWENW